MRLFHPFLIALLLSCACTANPSDKRAPDACAGSLQCHDLSDQDRGGGDGGMGGSMGHGMH